MEPLTATILDAGTDAVERPVVPFVQNAEKTEKAEKADREEKKLSFREVFHLLESPLLRYAVGMVGQREAAEDLVQEAFLKLHAHWAEVEQPSGWLFRTLKNLALNYLRDHPKKPQGDFEKELAEDSPGPDEALEKTEAIGALRFLLSGLDEETRALISLKYHENLKYEQISQRMGLSVSHVGYKLHHALKHLADLLRRHGIESPKG